MMRNTKVCVFRSSEKTCIKNSSDPTSVECFVRIRNMCQPRRASFTRVQSLEFLVHVARPLVASPLWYRGVSRWVWFQEARAVLITTKKRLAISLIAVSIMSCPLWLTGYLNSILQSFLMVWIFLLYIIVFLFAFPIEPQ